MGSGSLLDAVSRWVFATIIWTARSRTARGWVPAQAVRRARQTHGAASPPSSTRRSEALGDSRRPLKKHDTGRAG